MLTWHWGTIESAWHNAFSFFGSGFLNMLKENVFTETNVLYVSVALIFIIGLVWITSFLFQDND